MYLSLLSYLHTITLIFVISGLFFIFSLEFFPPQQCQQHPETDRGLRIASGLLKEHWYFQSTLT